MADEMKIISNNNKPKKVNNALFAKFKNYNSSARSFDKSAMAAPPKNNIIRNNMNSALVEKDILLKENSNHYIYSGKFINYNFIKTVKKELVNKNYAIKYSDFKKTYKEKIL
jgi:hypothetical protein